MPRKDLPVQVQVNSNFMDKKSFAGTGIQTFKLPTCILVATSSILSCLRVIEGTNFLTVVVDLVHLTTEQEVVV